MGSEHQAMLWASLAASPRAAGARRGREGRGRVLSVVLKSPRSPRRPPRLGAGPRMPGNSGGARGARRYQLLAAEAFPAALPGNTIRTGGGGVFAPEAEAPVPSKKGVSGWDLLLLVLVS